MSNVNSQALPNAHAHGEGEPKDNGRREFFAKLGMGSLIVAAAGTGLFSYEYFSPNVLFEASPIIKAGKPDQFPANTVTLDPQSGIYLVNGAKGFYALGAICTHLGCLTAWKPELDGRRLIAVRVAADLAQRHNRFGSGCHAHSGHS